MIIKKTEYGYCGIIRSNGKFCMASGKTFADVTEKLFKMLGAC